MTTFRKMTAATLAAAIAGTAMTSSLVFAQGADSSATGPAPMEMAHQDGGFGPGFGGHGGRGGKHGKRMMERFDVNGDGAVTQDEIYDSTAAMFAEADADGSGSISLEEFKVQFLTRSSDHRVRAFQRLDRDGDGTVTRNEYDRVSDRMFSRLDRDGDGELKRVPRGEGRGMGRSDRDEARGEERGMGDGNHRAGQGGGRGHEDGHGYRGHDGPRGMAGMILGVFDADADGKVTRAEFDEIRGQLFASADSDGSGGFSLEDFSTIWMTINNDRVVDMFQRLDADGDLAITAEERAERTASMVERMDRNGDGVITKADFKRGKHGKHGNKGWKHGRGGDDHGKMHGKRDNG